MELNRSVWVLVLKTERLLLGSRPLPLGEGWGEGLAERNKRITLFLFSASSKRELGKYFVDFAPKPSPQPSPNGRGSTVFALTINPRFVIDIKYRPATQN